MAIIFEAGDQPCAVFSGRCVAEEADALLEWLRATPNAAANLASCETLHTALAQVLMAARVRLLVPPPDAMLAACLHEAGCLTFSPDAPASTSGMKKTPRGGKRNGKAVARGGGQQIDVGVA